MLTVASGCGEDTTASDEHGSDLDTIQSAAVTDCAPSGHYETCYEVDLDEVDHWKDTLPEPDWRTVEKDPEGHDVDYKITIEAKELNGGIMPTEEDQGYYDTEADYEEERRHLLGITDPDPSYIVVTRGSTAKKTSDGEPTEATTGVFLYDALTNDDGRIIIGDKDKTEDLIDLGRAFNFEQHIEDNGDSTSVDDGDSSTPRMDTSSSDPQEAVLSYQAESLWEADLRIAWDSKTGYWSDLSGVRRDGTECRVTWEWGAFGNPVNARWECYQATMTHQMETLVADGDQSQISPLQSEVYTDSLSAYIDDGDAVLVGKACAFGKMFSGKITELVYLPDVGECDDLEDYR